MTRKLVITQNITLDGVIGGAGWFDPTEDNPRGRELAAITRSQAAASDGFLVGRVTFEQMRGFWPQQAADATGVTDHLNRVQKYVVSSTLQDPGWDWTTVLRGGEGLQREIGELTEQPGADIVLTGSVTLAHRLLALRLVDELRLFLHPVVLGAGERLFPDGLDIPSLELLEQQQVHGVTVSRYAIAR